MQDAAGAVVAFEHVTKRYGGPTPPAVTDLTLTVPGRRDLRAGRPVGLRQDDDA